MSVNLTTNTHLATTLQPHTGPATNPARPQSSGELPATQVAAAPANEKADNEQARDTEKAKQQAANEHLTGHKKVEGRNERQGNKQDQEDEQLGAEKKKTGSNAESPQLSEDELREIQELASRDREVRAHESAHRAVAGQYAVGGVHFDYKTGPDGKRYAVGGEVNIDTAPVSGDPEATLQKANAIRMAAMAPAEPSPQDRSVAVQAMQMAAKARSEVLAEKINGGESQSQTTSAEESVENKTDAEQVADASGDQQASRGQSSEQSAAANKPRNEALVRYEQVAQGDHERPADATGLDLSA